MSEPALLADPPETLPAAVPAPAAAPSVETPRNGWGVMARLYLAAAVLAAGAIAQIGLFLYVRAGGMPPAAELTSPLKSLPLNLGNWRGEDIEITDRNALYGNEHLKRKYVLENGRQEVLVWMVYSRVGTDRDHHPEVCYAVKGKHEIASEHRALEVGEGAPVQVFCFGDERQSQFVYYWNYTLATPNIDGLDFVRRLYHRMRTRPASVTAEVFSSQRRGSQSPEVETFVAALDAQLHKIVGEHAQRSSERKPFTIMSSEEEPEQK